MAKLKLALIGMAIICAIGGAFATRVRQSCEYQTQYFKYANGYYQAGTYGVNYVCLGGAGFCTYVKSDPFDPNSFVPCRSGTFHFVY
jgi:hypothetical protein